MKNVLPIVFSVPTLLVWVALFYRILTGSVIPFGLEFGLALGGVSFLAFTASVAMSFVIPDSSEWRVAAVFNGIPFVLIALAALVLGLVESC